MRSRTALSTALVGLLVAGAATPSLAATKRKPKPIHGTYTAQALPDPSSTNPATNEPCKPNLPTGIFSKAFKVPAAGTLHVELANQLDWSIAIRDTDGSDEASHDGMLPTDKEMVDVPFKRGRMVSIDTCNFSGEPTVTVSYTFTYR